MNAEPSGAPASAPPVTIQILPKPDYPTFYVEGLTQLMAGFPNSRIVLHSMAQRDATNPGAPEVRHLACELVMPTSALLEIAQNLIGALAANKAQLEAAQLDWVTKLNALNASLITPQPGAQTVP
jgi:hypothetical protein